MTPPHSCPSLALGLSLLAGLPACEMGARTVGYEPIDSVEPGVERGLTRGPPCGAQQGGRVATDPAGSVALHVWVAGSGGGRELAPTYDAVDPDVRISLLRGRNLFADYCNRVAEWGADEIEEEWAAPQTALQHGTIEIDQDPDAPLDSIDLATVTLFDVTLHRQDAADEPEIVIDEFVMPR